MACGWVNYAGKSHTVSHQVFFMVIEGVLALKKTLVSTGLQFYRTIWDILVILVERKEVFWGTNREGDVLCISCLSLLLCACLEWVDKADEWLIPAFRLIRSNFWQAVIWNHCRITHTPENWSEIVGGWLHGSLLFQQRPLRKNRPLGHHICVVTVYLVACIGYSKWNLWNIGNYLQKLQSYYQKSFFCLCQM